MESSITSGGKLNKGVLHRKYEKLSMQKKMFLGYSIPVLFISIVILIAGFRAMQRRYSEQLRNDMEHFMLQADEQLSGYLQGLNYLSQLLINSRELRDILSEENFGNNENAVDIFWEFHKLDTVFQSVELSNSDYRVGMYIDDDLRYSNNNFYLYPLSRLEQNPDYPEIREQLDMGIRVYTILQDKRTSDPDSAQDMLAQLSRLSVSGSDGTAVNYIVKAEIDLHRFEKVLANAKLTETSVIYLESDQGEKVAFSDRASEDLLDLYSFRTPYYLNDWDTVVIGPRRYYYVERMLGWRGWRLISLVPVWEFAAQQFFLLIWMTAMIGSIVAVVNVISSRIASYYAGRIGTLNSKMLGLSEGTGGARLALPESGSSDEMDELYRNFDFMLDEVDVLMKEQYRLGRSISNAEMRALQAQINPHFLYNTLDLINWGALDHGADDVAKIARSLGQFYRLSLNHGRSAITIRDELRHVEAYTAIENAHYDGAVHLSVDVAEELMDYACLNITLQPFVENSIVHGIAEFSDLKECHIGISAEKQGNDILFYVTDDGHGIDPGTAKEIEDRRYGETGHGYGISNINFRIKLCYGEEYGIHYLPAEKGTKVEIKIRALTIEELEELLK